MRFGWRPTSCGGRRVASSPWSLVLGPWALVRPWSLASLVVGPSHDCAKTKRQGPGTTKDQERTKAQGPRPKDQEPFVLSNTSARSVMTSRTVTVVNQLGMHARAAARFVHLAARFQARVRVARDSREMDGKSIMGILLLAAARGSAITISAEGTDEGDAVEALATLVEADFPEDGCSA